MGLEWAYFFLILAALFYFWPKQKKFIHLVLIGIFLGLMVAAKNSFFVALTPFLFLEFWSNRQHLKKSLLAVAEIAVPFLLISVPFILIGGNFYFSDILNFTVPQNEPSFIFEHVFPDPYTYHYDRADFIKSLYDNAKSFPGGEFRLWGDTGFLLSQYGAPVSFFNRQILPLFYSAWIYLKGLFLSLTVFGGALSWILIALGTFELFKNKKNNYLVFAAAFISSWLIFLIALGTSNYSQLLIIAFAASIFLALGINRFSELAANYINLKRFRNWIIFGICAFFIIFYFQVSWWSLRELYANAGQEGQIIKVALAEKNKNLFNVEGVTAVGWLKISPALLTYYFDRNFITFTPQTVQKLAAQGKLNQVFKNYGITGFIGYDEQVTDIINKNTDNKLKNYSASIGDINFN